MRLLLSDGGSMRLEHTMRFVELFAGKLVEYDEPSRLMEINSSFSKLVAEYWSTCKKNH